MKDYFITSFHLPQRAKSNTGQRGWVGWEWRGGDAEVEKGGRGRWHMKWEAGNVHSPSLAPNIMQWLLLSPKLRNRSNHVYHPQHSPTHTTWRTQTMMQDLEMHWCVRCRLLAPPSPPPIPSILLSLLRSCPHSCLLRVYLMPALSFLFFVL